MGAPPSPNAPCSGSWDRGIKRHTGQRCLCPTPPRAGTGLFLVSVRIRGRGQQPSWNQPGQKVGFLGSWLKLGSGSGAAGFRYNCIQAQISRSLSLPLLLSLSLSPVTFFSSLELPLFYCRPTSHYTCKRQLLASHLTALPPKRD